MHMRPVHETQEKSYPKNEHLSILTSQVSFYTLWENETRNLTGNYKEALYIGKSTVL